MKGVVLHLFLAAVWLALSGHLDPGNFLFGLVLGAGLLWLASPADNARQGWRRAGRSVALLLFFLRELFAASLRIAYDVLTRRHHMKPAVIAVPLDPMTDLEVTFLACLITLTPGTLSLDLSADGRVLYVHEMYLDDVDRSVRAIREGFMRRLLEVMR